jgi:hypothetical protein
MSADTIINAAKAAWDVIKDGKPTAEIGDSTANAVPQVTDWMSLTDAQGPGVYRMYKHVSFLWPLDDYDHVQFAILLKWDYGARYKGGGAFIPNVWVEVPECFVGFPWDVNISLTAHNPTNAGSASAPLARLPVTVKGTVSSGAELRHVEWGFILFGDGSSSTG